MWGECIQSVIYMKKMLIDHFKEDIIVSDMIGKSDVITLRRTAKSILREFYQTPRNNSDLEKQAVIEAAAKLIKNEVKSVPGSKEYYPASSDISSQEKNLEYVTQSLQTFLEILFSEKDSDLKVSSIGQAIMQAVRPCGLLPPLQIGLGVQLNHNFGSRFLIDVCHALGFSASYDEVNRFHQVPLPFRVTSYMDFTRTPAYSLLQIMLITTLVLLMDMTPSTEWES